MFALIPLADCKAKDLFGFPVDGVWQGMRKHKAILMKMASAAAGLIPHQCSFHLQFRAWLARHDLTWSHTDSERAVSHLRSYGMKLQRANTLDHRLPKRFSDLEDLALAFKLEQQVQQPQQPQQQQQQQEQQQQQQSEQPGDSEVQVVPACASEVDVVSACDSSSDVEFVGTSFAPECAIDFDELESELFDKHRRISSKRRDPKQPDPTTVDDAEMLSLMAGAFEAELRAPLPADYKLMTAQKKEKNKKKKKKTKKRTTTKKQKRDRPCTPKKAAKAQAAPADTPPPKAVAAPATTPPPPNAVAAPANVSVSVDAIARKYVGEPITSSAKKRVHSNAWHRQMALCRSQGIVQADASSSASAVAKATVARWIDLKKVFVE